MGFELGHGLPVPASFGGANLVGVFGGELAAAVVPVRCWFHWAAVVVFGVDVPTLRAAGDRWRLRVAFSAGVSFRAFLAAMRTGIGGFDPARKPGVR